MSLLINILLFFVGLAAIIKGADWLTDGAAAIARYFGIPTIVVGLTIVAIGSSAPEFVVSVVSAIRGNSDMALGNVVGSNIFNILAIMGVTAFVAPVKVSRENVRNDLSFIVLSSIVIAITALDTIIDGTTPGVISRSEGLMMLCMFAIFMSYTFSIAKAPSPAPSQSAEPAENASRSIWFQVFLVIVGLAGLIIGGEWMVDGAVGMARAIGI
ncbi:MAG: sodium:calcium antiporter, partial [Prevotella sp.]|nr:sodium:calcium antiporter [Prevotella sp.]